MNHSSTPQSSSGVSSQTESAPLAEAHTSHVAPTPAVPSRRTEVAAAKRIATFFLFLVLCLFGFHQLIQFGMRRIETGGFGVTNRIVSGQVNADIIISGSSRALTHYDPRIIQQITGRTAYNIGRNGSQTDMQVAVLKTYLQHNTPPKLVIHNLDSFSFVTTKEIYDPAQYLPYLDEEPIYETVARISPNAWKWKRFPLYGYAVEDMRFTWTFGLRTLAGIQPRETRVSGFEPRYAEWTEDFERYRKVNPNGVQFPITPSGVDDVKEIVAISRSRGIPLLFVYSPVYFQMQQLETNRSEVFREFHLLNDGASTRFWDFSGSPISMDKRNFYNSQHLNASGAHAFSVELSNRMTDERILEIPQTQ